MTHPAYFIFDVKVHDYDAIKPYVEKVAETYKAFGGKPIVQGSSAECFEGSASEGRMFILQFESLENAQAWYASPEYQAIIGYRLAGSEGNAYLVEGIAG